MEHYEMHCSPDLWSSGSSLPLEELAAWAEAALEKEIRNISETAEAVSSSVTEVEQVFAGSSLPLEELAAWAEAALEKEMRNNISETAEAVSSSVTEQEQFFAVPRNQDGNNTPTSATCENEAKAKVVKGRVRVVFTDSQLETLVSHFSMKCYPDPWEMTELAEKTGLTYKQVKTWFQNTRRKFRNSSHPQHVNQAVPLHFQGEGQPPQQYNHMDINLMRMGANNQAHYPHDGGDFATGSQLTFPKSPRMLGWPMPPGNNHYEYNPVAVNSDINVNNSGLGWPMPPGNGHYGVNSVSLNPDMSVNNSRLHKF